MGTMIVITRCGNAARNPSCKKIFQVKRKKRLFNLLHFNTLNSKLEANGKKRMNINVHRTLAPDKGLKIV